MGTGTGTADKAGHGHGHGHSRQSRTGEARRTVSCPLWLRGGSVVARGSGRADEDGDGCRAGQQAPETPRLYTAFYLLFQMKTPRRERKQVGGVYQG